MAVSTPGAYGHVALVVAINGGVITVDQYNYYANGTFSQNKGTPSSFAAPFTRFVHFEKYETANISVGGKATQVPIQLQIPKTAPTTTLRVRPSNGSTAQQASGTIQIQPANGATILQGSGASSSTPIQIHQQTPTNTQQQSPTQTQTPISRQAPQLLLTNLHQPPTLQPPNLHQLLLPKLHQLPKLLPIVRPLEGLHILGQTITMLEVTKELQLLLIKAFK